jgi:ferrochelatase
VVLTQMGGPDGLDDVAPFIRSIFADPAMVALPGGAAVRGTLSRLVATTRSPAVRRRYAQIGGGSPIGRITAAQAEALQHALVARGHDAVVAVAMRYTQPDTVHALDTLLDAGVDRLVALPLYPQWCAATSGSSETELGRVLAQRPDAPPVTVLGGWADHPAYLDLLASLTQAELDAATTTSGVDGPDAHAPGPTLLFSAHGIPQRLADRGDPYPDQVAATVEGVRARLRGRPEARLTYQSRTGPVRWLGPDAADTVRELGAGGCTSLVVVPVSFVSDHIETLHELDIELAEIAHEAGIGQFRRVPVLNDRPEAGSVLADVLETLLEAGPLSSSPS